MFGEWFIFGLSIYAWITMLTIISIFVVMARSRIPAEIAFLGALTVLLVTGVVTEEEGMAGFGSEPVVVHAAFFVIIAGLMQTGVLYWLTKNVLGDPNNYNNALLRLMVPTSILAALPICRFVQGLPWKEILLTALRGFAPADPETAALVRAAGSCPC